MKTVIYQMLWKPLYKLQVNKISISFGTVEQKDHSTEENMQQMESKFLIGCWEIYFGKKNMVLWRQVQNI